MEQNQGIRERRPLVSRPVAAEAIGFPFAAQVAWLTRQHAGRANETVGLITGRFPRRAVRAGVADGQSPKLGR